MIKLGRPAKNANRSVMDRAVPINVFLPAGMIEDLNKFSENQKVNRSEVIRQALQAMYGEKLGWTKDERVPI